MAEEKKKIKKKRTLLQKIVNVFLYAGIVLFILVVLAFGFSQTSTFRDYLRDKVVNVANSELNGKISIGKIDGTIFTSLILRNTVVSTGKDTILNAGSIEVRTSPLKILLKTIYVRYFEIKDAKIHLVKEKDGKLNITKLFPPPSGDTTKSEFPFKIQVAVLKLSDINFSLQKFDKVNNKETYDSLNTGDIRIKNLNLRLNAYAYIKNNDYDLSIDNLSFDSNIKGVELKKLKGDFQIQEDKIRINYLRVLTQNTDLMLNAGADNLNLFGNSISLSKALLEVKLDAPQFNFSDLSAFVPATKILNGNIAVNFIASGTLKKLHVKNLEAALPKTHIQSKLLVENIDDPDDMNFNARFRNSYIDQEDVANLLPSLGIPVFEDYGPIKFDTLNYNGNPLNFKVKLYANTDKGSFGAVGSINLLNKSIQYDLNAFTKKFNIKPIAGLYSRINSRLTINGKGVSPEELQTKINLVADGSSLEGSKIDTLRLTADAQKKKINYNLSANSNHSSAKINGYFDFTNQSDPSYDLEGNLNDINISEFTKDTTLKTNLNFNVSAIGDKFNLNLMNLFLSMKMYHSEINGIIIDSTRAIVDLRHDDKGKRVVNIVSDLADITMIGKFTIPQTVTFFKGEIGFLSTAFKDKMDKIFPDSSNKFHYVKNYPSLNGNNNSLITPVDSLMDVNYAIEFKDFSLLSLFLGSNQLEIDGDVSGQLKNTPDSMTVNVKTNLKSLKFWGKDDVFFLSNLDLNLDVGNGINSDAFSDVYLNLSLSTDRVFVGEDFYNLNLNITLNDDTAAVSFGAKLQDYAAANFSASVNLKDSTVQLNIDTLKMNYNTFAWSNRRPMHVDYGDGSLKFNDFVLSRNETDMEINGIISQSNQQDFEINLSNLSLNDLLVNMLGYQPSEVPDSRVSVTLNGLGTFSNPQINCFLDLEGIKYKNQKFGKLIGPLNYQNRSLSVNVQFLDSLINRKNPVLFVNGKIPIDLSIQSVDKRLIDTEPVNIILSAKDFKLGAFGDVLPAVNKLRGTLEAKIDITGKLNNLNPNGYLQLTNTAFLLQANNLEYDAGLKVNFDGESANIDSLIIKNSDDTKDGGTMSGSGVINLHNLDATSFNLAVNGKLKILGNKSKLASHDLFGDLVLATNGKIKVQGNKDGTMVTASLIVDKGDITYLPIVSGYKSGSSKFVYKYVVDTSNQKNKSDFERLMNLANERSAKKSMMRSTESKFDYDINIEVQNEATVTVVLSKELNQNLTAILKGNLTYENLNGRPNAQGELNLVEGSTLEFIKTFKADGTIKFEGDLYNPNLNVTATYSDYYYPASADSAASTQEVPVAVKIKIKGPLEELNKNFVQETNNIAVYYGQKNIDNDVPDASKNASDAVMFIIAGKFTEGATQQDRNAAAATATSLAGSLVGSFLNKQLGDYVRSLEVRQVGSTTKFNLSGKVKDIRYTIGGTTDIFQDISRANVRIEYPLYKSLLLRLERKEAINETGISNEMVNELGLKYQFEF